MILLITIIYDINVRKWWNDKWWCVHCDKWEILMEIKILMAFHFQIRKEMKWG